MLSIVFDENVPDCIVTALTALTEIAFPLKEVKISSVRLLGLTGKSDEDVLHAVGKNGILITYDKDFKTQRALSHIINQYSIGVYWVRQPNIKTVWLLAQLMVEHWQDILNKSDTEDKPFLFEVTKKGIERRQY